MQERKIFSVTYARMEICENTYQCIRNNKIKKIEIQMREK